MSFLHTLSAMVITHYNSLEDCLTDVAPLMENNLHLCEMMDKVILDCTKNNREQLANRFFVEGDPEALLMSQVNSYTEEDLELQIQNVLKTVKKSNVSYAEAILKGEDITKAVVLRKAGLGLLGNLVGDKKSGCLYRGYGCSCRGFKKILLENLL